MADNKGLLLFGLGLAAGAGIVALASKPLTGGGGNGTPVQPSYWVTPPYPAFPPTWWSGSFNGTYVLMRSTVGEQAWIFPNDVPVYLDGGWIIVP